jgi:hypothetical protein
MFDLKKQPMWVQDKVEWLERENDRLGAELALRDYIDYAGDLSPEGPSGVQRGGEIEVQPPGAHHFFAQRDRNYIMVRQTINDPTVLEIMSMAGGLIVEPQMSNVIHIRMKER